MIVTIENVVNEGIKKQIIINVPLNTEIKEKTKYELKEYKEKRSNIYGGINEKRF